MATSSRRRKGGNLESGRHPRQALTLAVITTCRHMTYASVTCQARQGGVSHCGAGTYERVCQGVEGGQVAAGHPPFRGGGGVPREVSILTGLGGVGCHGERHHKCICARGLWPYHRACRRRFKMLTPYVAR